MTAFKRLLAKSSYSPDNPNDRETLPGHLRDVVVAAQALMDSVGQSALESLRLAGVFDRDDLSKAVTCGAFLHDLGKANHQFQRMVRPGAPALQALRHEWISSWLLLKFPELNEWLFAGSSTVVRQAALCAALGHHLKIEDGSALNNRGGSGETAVAVYTDHPDFLAALQIAPDNFGATKPPLLPNVEIDLLSRPLPELRSWLKETVAWYEDADPGAKSFVIVYRVSRHA